MSNELIAEIRQLQMQARFYFDQKNDVQRALELATRAQELLLTVTDNKRKESDLHAAMANVWLSLGRDELVEQEIRLALEAEASVEPRRPIIKATEHLFFAKFLYERQRFGEAAAQARLGLSLYSDAQPDGSKELTYIRQLMTPILMAGESAAPVTPKA
jgi:hypothetical protein